jgi:hypothetical protein
MPGPGSQGSSQMLCQTRRELELDKQYVDEVVEKYAPGSTVHNLTKRGQRSVAKPLVHSSQELGELLR